MRLVIKAGGRVLEENIEAILEDIAKLAKNHEIVFVHGGGDIVTKYSKAMGIEPKFVISPSGIRSRYTDEREIEIYTMVMAGLLNKRIVAKLQHMGIKSVGFSGVDGAILLAKRKKHIVVVDERGRKRLIPGGYTGKIVEVNSKLMELLLEKGFTLVVSPLALGEEGELLNVDGDHAASKIAIGLKADILLFLTDVEGVFIDGKLVERISVDESRELLSKIGVGMNRKVMHAIEAVKNGVEQAIIGLGLGSNPIQKILERSIKATHIVRG
ncbi:MAG TPA: [LysW]-aminoadipate/[LysW]-glutamate kinase [Pyrodictium sp.]|nr:[LysW]-aminoadipate/[LysW]-glutamate kinase [Pyrodictium sp.]HIQ10426.1 [LysW]-aminoadipate/[LysW]-glutamate kinase [Pyrodictium sp.]HIQ55390.1 [LysW]-aminoadipate/[LysW]-glutamate kinase [Pyrodictium sp.]